jgi:hypothetical protein
MHRDHDHHDHGHGGALLPGPGHNRAAAGRPAAQWQLLHGAKQPESEGAGDDQRDLDLVAAAFVEGFLAASDPTSFLRLAQVPFEGTDAEGVKLSLLRVEIDAVADVGAIAPHLGGGSFRYDPLPGRLVSRRKRLRLVYFDGQGLRQLDLAEALKLST